MEVKIGRFQTSGVSDYLGSVFFFDENNGWTLTNNSGVIHTSDGGDNWTFQSSLNDLIYEVFFTSATDGWICGRFGMIYHTTDGGETWTITETGTYEGFFTICFINSTTGWVAGSGGITARTTDGGENWELVYSYTSSFLYSMSFTDENNGWIAGRTGTILHTSNGGQTWTTQPCGTGVDLQGICFVNNNDGWVVGDEGTILHTSTGGTMGIELYPINSPNSNQMVLHQNFPNPFVDFTCILIEIPGDEGSEKEVVLNVYNLAGVLVKNLYKGHLNTGNYEVSWDGTDQFGIPAVSGIYILQLERNGQTISKKINLSR